MEQLRAIHRANKKECLTKFGTGALTENELVTHLNRAYHAGRNVGREEVRIEALLKEERTIRQMKTDRTLIL